MRGQETSDGISDAATQSVKVSIVLPTHNGSRFLNSAIESVVGQTFENWELIIVDDASTDPTPAIISAWARRDCRIRSLSLGSNVGLPAALNHGFAIARGPLLTWTSDDNQYRPTALSRLHAEIMEHDSADLVYSDWILNNAGREKHIVVGAQRDVLTANIVGPCFLYRRQVHEQLGGYDESCFLAEDYDFWLRAARNFRFWPLHETLYEYRFHDGSLSASRRLEVNRMTELVLDRAMLAVTDQRERTRALVAWGRRAATGGDTELATRYLKRAIRSAGLRAAFRFRVDLLRILWHRRTAGY